MVIFQRPTDADFDSNGNIYVTDLYGIIEYKNLIHLELCYQNSGSYSTSSIFIIRMGYAFHS